MKLEELKKAALESLKHPGGAKEPLPKDESHPPILYLFRHTQTTDNVKRIFSGRRQPNLTALGRKQANRLARLLKNKKIDLFLSPPQKRCHQTLVPLMNLFPKVEYRSLDNLQERDYGDLTGKNKLEIMEKYPEKAILWRRSWNVSPPGGESLKKVWETRVKKFCLWLEKKMKKEKINVAYCGTNNTVRLIRMYFEKLSIEKTLTLENPYGDYAAYSLGR